MLCALAGTEAEAELGRASEAEAENPSALEIDPGIMSGPPSGLRQRVGELETQSAPPAATCRRGIGLQIFSGSKELRRVGGWEPKKSMPLLAPRHDRIACDLHSSGRPACPWLRRASRTHPGAERPLLVSSAALVACLGRLWICCPSHQSMSTPRDSQDTSRRSRWAGTAFCRVA